MWRIAAAAAYLKAIELTMNAYRLLTGFIVISQLAGCYATPGDAQSKLNHWNAVLSKELPVGTPKTTVEAFFSTHGLEHSYSPSDHSIAAIDREVGFGSMVTTSITFNCALDQTERLKSCSVALVHTGP